MRYQWPHLVGRERKGVVSMAVIVATSSAALGHVLDRFQGSRASTVVNQKGVSLVHHVGTLGAKAVLLEVPIKKSCLKQLCHFGVGA